MGSTDMGTQLLSFDFLNPGSSLSFNKLLLDLIPPGIYSGGLITIVGEKPQVAPLTAFMVTNNAVDHADPNVVGVRVQTSANYTVSEWTTSLKVIVMRLAWSNVSNNYADIFAVATPQAGDLIIGYVPDTNQGNVTYTHATYPRSIVVRYADTLPLMPQSGGNGALPSSTVFASPQTTDTPATNTTFVGTQTINIALDEIFARLRDLSGAKDQAVRLRHLDLGAGASHINARAFQIDVASSLTFYGGASVAAGESVMTAMTKFYTALNDLSGVATDSVGSRLVNWGTGGDQVNGGQMPANVTATYPATGGVGATAPADTVQSVFTKVIGALADLSGTGDAKVLNRHIDFTSTKAEDFSFRTMFTQAVSGFVAITININDSIKVAFQSIMTRISDVATALASLTTTVGGHTTTLGNQSTLNGTLVTLRDTTVPNLATTVGGHTTTLSGLATSKQDALPLGTILMYDGGSWPTGLIGGTTPKDGASLGLPGWYACSAENNGRNGNIPNLEDRFIKAVSPANWNVSGASGSGLVTLAAVNLPPHIHEMDHTHVEYDTIGGAGNSQKTGNTNNMGAAINTSLASRQMTSDGSTVAESHLGATPVNLGANIKQYALIYIKRIS